MQKLVGGNGINANCQVRILVDNEQAQRDVTQILERHRVGAVSHQNPDSFFFDDGPMLPACVVLDWQCGPHDPLEIAERCREQWPHTPVLLLCEDPTVAFTVSAMRKGADGVLEKPINANFLIREVQAAIERSQARQASKFDPVEACKRIKEISNIELEILNLIADGVPNKNIAVAMTLSLRTVEKYRHSLFETLGVTSAAEATRIWVLANLGQ